MKLTPAAPGRRATTSGTTTRPSSPWTRRTRPRKTAALHTAVGGPWMSVTEAREEDGLPEEVKGTIYPPPNMNAPTG